MTAKNIMEERQIDSEIVSRFVKNLKKEDKIKIVMHDVPDPDAMGSAVGMQYLFKQLGFPSTIHYRGDISHPQNKTLMNVLNLSFTKENASAEVEGNVVVVDGTENNSVAGTPDLVIDHHKNDTLAEYKLVEPTYGSCSTIVFKLIKSLLKDWKGKENTFIFTALLLGIRTDTNDLISENMTVDDFQAYQELLEVVDKEALQKVMNYPLPKYLYDHRLALHREGNYHEANGIFVGGIGYISSAQRDAIAVLSEEYARMETVNTSVIFAIVNKDALHVSVRSSNVSLDVGAMCKEVFGNQGGGTSYKGGATIPLSFYSNLENGEKEKFWNITCTTMFRRILKEAFVGEEHDN